MKNTLGKNTLKTIAIMVVLSFIALIIYGLWSGCTAAGLFVNC